MQVLVEVQDLERDASLPRPLDRPVADLLAVGARADEQRRDATATEGAGGEGARRTLSTLASKVCAAVAQAASSSASCSSSSRRRRGAWMAKGSAVGTFRWPIFGQAPERRCSLSLRHPRGEALSASLALSERPSPEQAGARLSLALSERTGLWSSR